LDGQRGRAPRAHLRINGGRQKAARHRRISVAGGDIGRQSCFEDGLTMSIWSRIANEFRPRRLRREIDEELESHIEEAIAQGRDPAEARKAFGSTLQRREESLDAR